MMTLACPHCQVLGQIPKIVLQNSAWPIACHHCHQHYFAPVISGPSPLAHVKKIACKKCKKKAEIEADKLQAVLASSTSIFCPDCHTELATPARKAKQKQHEEHHADKSDKQLSSQPPVLPGWRAVLFLVFVGFALTFLAVVAANEGWIDRVWLDQLLRNLPDRSVFSSQLNELFR